MKQIILTIDDNGQVVSCTTIDLKTSSVSNVNPGVVASTSNNQPPPAVFPLDDRVNKLQFPLKCLSCKEELHKGDMVFYRKHGPNGKPVYWHYYDKKDGTKCYDPAWKAAGTPADTRKKMAIGHAIEKKGYVEFEDE